MFAKDAIQLGISPLGWTNDDFPELGGDISFEHCITEMAAAGFTGCEVGNRFPRDPQVLQQALQAKGLVVVSQWFSSYFTEPDRYNETVENFKKHRQFLKSMGAKVIVVCECGGSIQQASNPILGEKPTFTQAQWLALVEGLHGLGVFAAQYDMQVVYHPHMGTGIQNFNEISYLMDNTDPQLVSLLFDSGHCVFADVNPTEFISRYGDRIKHVHLKDIRAEQWEQTRQQQLSFLDAVKTGVFTVPGDGFIDFKTIFQALKDAQYRGWFVVEAEQDPQRANPLVYAKKARDYIKSTLGI